MVKKPGKVKLTEKDRKTLLSNLKICTDLHGQHCIQQNPSEKLKA